MATSASAFSIPQSGAPLRFFRITAIVMTLLVLSGFSTQWLMGRSSFSARPLVHAHAFVFMGWVAIFFMQAMFATGGRIDLHRRLAKLAVIWAPLLVLFGFWISIDVTRRGIAPFFFKPQHFLIANPASVLVFAAMFIAAVRMHHRPDWHMRLHIGAMAILMGPAFGRLLPMPLLIPYAFQAAGVACLLFPIAGIIRDWRVEGRPHPAYWISVAAILGLIILPDLIAYSPLGDAIYAWVTTGHPGANVPGLQFAPFPPGL